MRYTLFLFFPIWAMAETITFKNHGHIVKSYSLEELNQVVDATDIRVFEPHDKEEQTFRGFSVPLLFDKVYGKSWRKEEEILIGCVDGYQPSIPADEFQKFSAYLVYRRKNDDTFLLKPKSNEDEGTELGPFYLVWDNVKSVQLRSQGGAYWPYQLNSVDVVRFSDRFKTAAPPVSSSEQVRKGFIAFRTRCMACHTINGEGWKKGVELNYPVSVTEYLSDRWIRKWVLDPSSMRMNTSMPAFPKEGKDWKKDFDAVIAYLKAMAKNKKTPKAVSAG